VMYVVTGELRGLEPKALALVLLTGFCPECVKPVDVPIRAKQIVIKCRECGGWRLVLNFVRTKDVPPVGPVM